jgi:hypothetical protein
MVSSQGLSEVLAFDWSQLPRSARLAVAIPGRWRLHH